MSVGFKKKCYVFLDILSVDSTQYCIYTNYLLYVVYILCYVLVLFRRFKSLLLVLSLWFAEGINLFGTLASLNSAAWNLHLYIFVENLLAYSLHTQFPSK